MLGAAVGAGMYKRISRPWLLVVAWMIGIPALVWLSFPAQLMRRKAEAKRLLLLRPTQRTTQ